MVLSRDLSEFLVELSIALHRHSMYPSGHPSLAPTIEAVARRAGSLLHDRSSIAFGIARRQLIIEGVSTDPGQPVLRRLAEGLHRHHIGAVSIRRGVEPREFADALSTLATESDEQGPLGLSGHVSQWPHITLHPLTFDGLALVDDAPIVSPDDSDGRDASKEAALWIGLARAALSTAPGQGIAPVQTEPTVVARAIDEHPRAEAYDQVIVGYLLQIAQELKTVPDARAFDLRRRTSRLIASLQPDTLRRLVEMGGDVGQRGQFVLDSAQGMAVDAVIEIVKAAGDASGQTISHGLIRMLSKLALHAEAGSDRARSQADTELREQVGRLVQGWQLDDPNPDAYGRVLQHLATSAHQERSTLAGEVNRGPDPVRLVQISLESGTFGPLVHKALGAAVREGQTRAVIALLDSVPPAVDGVADAVLTELAQADAIKVLLAHDPLDITSLDVLLPHVTIDGYAALLDALVSSRNRTTRRRLLDRLSRAGTDISALATERLGDERWYVQRNMLVLLERMERLPEGFSPQPWTRHPDARVRVEAIRLQLRIPSEKNTAIAHAIDDPDARVAHLGLTSLQHSCPDDLIYPVVHLVLDPARREEIRILAISVVGHIRQPPVLDALLHLVAGTRSLLGRLRLPATTPLMLAALRALATTWGTDPRAEPVIAAARKSSDPDVRDAVSPPVP